MFLRNARFCLPHQFSKKNDIGWPQQPHIIKTITDPDGLIISSTQLTNTCPLFKNTSSPESIYFIHFAMRYPVFIKDCSSNNHYFAKIGKKQKNDSHLNLGKIFDTIFLGSNYLSNNFSMFWLSTKWNM